MVDINEIYKSQSEYIKAEDIGSNMWTFTIKTAEPKRFDDGSSKIILTFHEWDKGLPLNITNARAIADLYGHNSNSWVGQQIMLMSMPVDYQGKTVNGIRVRAPVQGQPRQSQPNPAQVSHQRPLNQDYANASGGSIGYSDRNPPPPTESDMQF